MLKEIQHDLVETASNRFLASSLTTHSNSEKRRNEVSFIECAIPALFCVQGGRHTTRNRMDYDRLNTFKINMNDLNDGKDRFILMGTLFIVLFLFLL